MRLHNKVALITGGASGIGKAVACRFAEEGAIVVIADWNEEAGNTALADIRSLSPESSFFKVDVSSREGVQDWMEDVFARYKQIDILVNNAGVLRDNQLVKIKDGEVLGQMPESEFDLVIAVNLKGPFNCAQAVVPFMQQSGGGVILNAASVVGLDGNFGQTNYVASKAGVIGMTKVWARELGKHNIRVNAVAPGFTATEMVTAMPEKILDGMRRAAPLRRLGEPRDIANAYLFLASDEAAFITGETLRVDGGIVVGT